MALTFKKEQPKQEDLIEKLDEVNKRLDKITAKSEAKEPKDDEAVEDDKTVLASDDAEDQVDNDAAELQKQIDALKKSEELHRTRVADAEKERDAAIQRINEQATESVKLRKETFQSQADAIEAAIAAATTEAERATADIENYGNLQDWKAMAEAQRRLSRAEANLSKLEDGKLEVEQRIKAVPEKPETVERKPQDNTPELVKSWISKHPDYIQEPRKNDKIKALHWDALDAGHSYGSQEYIDFIDTELGFKKAPVKDEDDDGEPPARPQQRNSILSAPVSREAPSTPGKDRGGTIKLNREQREAAAAAGITEAEYAKQLRKLNEMKANGSYGDRQ